MHPLHRHTVAFEQRLRAEMATRIEPLPFGAVVITADLPDVYDHNLVQIDTAAPADVVLAAVDEAVHRHGWHHRSVDVADAAIAAPLVAAFRSAGYVADHLITMALLGAPQDHGSHDHRAAAALADVGEHRHLARALVAEQSSVTSGRVLDQFSERERRLARHAGARAVVAPPSDPVSRCLLLTDGAIVQIDAVATLSQHRGHGWSNAVMHHAIATAGRRRVVLVADEGDWPAQWYARLGFRPVGRSVSFRRWPEDR